MPLRPAWLAALAALPAVAKASSSSTCPGSPVKIHAICDMTVTFPSTPCAMIQEEMTMRISGKAGWIDPHNAGTYTIGTQDDDNVMEGSRLTGDGRYTDLWKMTFSDSNGGCVVEACSEAQVMGVLDFSTNYCNLRSLYCNKSVDGCPIVTHDFTDYQEEYNRCFPHEAENCIPANEEI